MVYSVGAVGRTVTCDSGCPRRELLRQSGIYRKFSTGTFQNRALTPRDMPTSPTLNLQGLMTNRFGYLALMAARLSLGSALHSRYSLRARPSGIYRRALHGQCPPSYDPRTGRNRDSSQFQTDRKLRARGCTRTGGRPAFRASRSVLPASASTSRQWTQTFTYQVFWRDFSARNPGWPHSWVKSAVERGAKPRQRHPEQMAGLGEDRGRCYRVKLNGGCPVG